MNILTFSSLYPNNEDPTHGIFVERRLRELTERTDIRASVVAPVPWFPFRSKIFDRYSAMARIAREDRRFGIEIRHPRFFLMPKVGMNSAPKFMALACRRTVEDYVRRYSVAVIDAHYFYPDGVAAALIAEKIGVPYLITARGSDINLISQYASPRRQMLKAAAGAHALIAVSEALAQAMADMGMEREKIHVLRNGVDLGFFRPGNRDQVRKTLSATETVFVSVGALKSAKGHDIAIEFVSGIDNASLVVIGQGQEEGNLRALARRLGVEGRVLFTGPLEPEGVLAWYQAADASILMSKREGMPNVVLESLACGTPVMASDVGGIPELISAPEAGEIATVRTVEGLRDAWTRMNKRTMDRDRTREFAEQFAWTDTVIGLTELMSHAVGAQVVETRQNVA